MRSRYYHKYGQKLPGQLSMSFDFPRVVRCKLLRFAYDCAIRFPPQIFLVFIREFGFNSFSFRDIGCLIRKVVQKKKQFS